jgi:TatD DNase family protein
VDGLPPLWLEDLISLLRSGGCVVGEIGIDHWKDGIDRELQEEVFLKQLAVARQLNLPVTIHGLKAWDRLLQLLKSEGPPKAGFLLHSYSGPASLVASFVELGAYFSCAPAFFAPSREKKLQVFRLIPLERLLAETDSPDQAPPNELSEFSFSDESAVGLNHPANIRLVYDGLAKLRQMPASSMAEKILENYQRLFG